MTSIRKTLRIVAVLTLIALASQGVLSTPGPRTLVPNTGALAIRMRAQELTSGLRILMISLRPGDEDLTTLAYLRFGAGAQVTNAYITNGESGEHDASGVLPRQLAAERRTATSAALEKLEVDVRFLNFPDPGNVADRAAVNTIWSPDFFQEQLAGLVAAAKPHLVMLSRDWEGGLKSPLWSAARSTLQEIVSKNNPRKSAQSGVVQKDRDQWTVFRLWVDEGKSNGLMVPWANMSPVLGKSYRDIALELAREYPWQRSQRRGREQAVRYSLESPAGQKRPRTLESGVDLRIPQDLKRLHTILRSYDRDVQQHRAPRSELLRRTLKVMDSVDMAIGSTIERTGLRMKILVDWKSVLENLRNALLGVTVDYSISEEILTERQLTYIRINAVTGRSDGGSTDVYFPSAERGWILNEGLRSKIPLEIPGEYRVVSPERVTYDLPAADYNLDQPVTGRPVMLFLLHKGRTREENFTYRISLPIRYAPRLAVEVLTPIVRCSPGEFLVTHLTNNSRDGLRDTLSVNDINVQAPGKVVRLNAKGLSQRDTLQLSWRDSIPEGTYTAPVSLGGIEVARFAARKFDVAVDTTLSVGLVTSLEASSTADALRRLGLPHVSVMRNADALRANVETLDVLLVDRRYTTLAPDGVQIRPLLDDVNRRGGHVILLAQDAEAWNASPLWDILRLQHDPTIAPQVPAVLDTAHPALRTPNPIDSSAFRDWVFASGYNRISITGSVPVETPVRYDDLRPLLMTAPVRNGRMTYVDLALGPQWMGIHPGAFKLLANLLSMRTARNAPR